MVEYSFKGGSTGGNQYFHGNRVIEELNELHEAADELEKCVKRLRSNGVDVRLVANGGTIYVTTMDKP